MKPRRSLPSAAATALIAGLLAASSAPAAETGDVSGMWWASSYSPSIKSYLVGGGDVPLNDAGRKKSAEIQAGKESFEAMSRCWPGGVPGMMLFTAEPAYFLQTPKEGTILYSRGPHMRHIYMNVPHSQNPKPSWMGESFGHYEGGEFVVDTIGLNDKTFIDWYHTPHTEKLHVVERYKLIEGGKRLQGMLTVEDPGTFTTKWSAVQRFRRIEDRPLHEEACAENNFDYFNFEVVPLPQADKPDF